MRQQSYYVIFNTAAGWVGLLGSATGLKRTTLPQPSEEQAIADLCIDFTKTILTQKYFNDLVKRFQDYFAGKRVDFPDKLDLNESTAFQLQVWEATRQIPYGQTRSYSQIAYKIGKPGAARAVGQALGKNPLPIIIPCHRVLNNNGALGGFSGGRKMKEYLLTLEKIQLITL
jgi:methylated-DNA-[protein]-cysteine S-methyltransferase